MTAPGDGLPGEAWDDATTYYGVGAGWRIRVLRQALRQACADVLRLGGEGAVEHWAPQTADELADGYTEWAEATLLVGEVELEARGQAQGSGGGSAGPAGPGAPSAGG